MSDAIQRLNAALQGRYHIERELGEGGMAKVYLADDVKHERKVALKVLKPELAAVVGAERFLAEIKTTAKLTHPHILPLHDSGEADSFLFYVMPHVQGESLRERLDRERQLPVDDAVQIATNVAEALDYAHRQGVIHRDIKPANILLIDGKPVISDFGIALAVGAAGGGRLTETGLSLGTPHYMSPEQATGDQNVGPATDTYALGCVLYEMLVGDPPYTGSTAQAILGKIIMGTPDAVTEHRGAVPPNIEAALRKTLEKVPADRFATAQDFGRALGDPAFRYGSGEDRGASRRGRANTLSWPRALHWVLTAGLAAAVIVLAAKPLTRGQSGVIRASIPVGRSSDASPGEETARIARTPYTDLAFSPDGAVVVYATGQGEGLYRHRLNQDGADLIEGTESGVSPFFSPDGAWIGFIHRADQALKRISVTDGTIETIAPIPWGNGVYPGMTWGDDETIVADTPDALYQVDAKGGEWALVLEADPIVGESFRFSQPHMLPGSEMLLVQVTRSWNPEQSEIVAVELATGTRTPLLTDAMEPFYIDTGHLLFMRQGTLMAVGFNLQRLEVVGQPVIMVEDVMHSILADNSERDTGAGQVALSAAGHLAYVRGGVVPERASIAVRVTEGGDTVALDMAGRGYIHFRVSPNGSQIASVVAHGQPTDIWVRDLTRSVAERLSTGGLISWPVEWSPDGKSLVLSSDRDQANVNLYTLSLDGSSELKRLAPSDREQLVSSWSSDGVIAFLEGGDIWMLPPDGSPSPFFPSKATERDATFSPDAQWLAYVSNRSGRNDVYVRAYPGPGPATLISGDGGTNPAWSPDGRRVYYVRSGVLMGVDVRPGDEFQAGRPTRIVAPWTLSMNPVEAMMSSPTAHS